MTEVVQRVRLGLVLLLGVLLLAGQAEATVRGNELIVPSVARAEGAGGSQWYTTLWLHNPGGTSAQLSLSLLRRGRPNPTPEQQFLRLEAGQTITVDDLLWDLFGLEQGAGALRVEASHAVAVSARVFNLPGSDPAESQGQFMAGVPATLALAAGDSTDIAGVSQPVDGSFRCNFGLVETGGGALSVRVSLVDGAGATVADREYSLGPFEVLQKNLDDLGANTAVDGGRLHVAHLDGAGRLLAYASLVANGLQSQDPSTLEMETEAEAAAGGGVGSVLAGRGLTGGGSGAEVVLDVVPGAGLEIAGDSVGIAEKGIRESMVADDQLVRSVVVGGRRLRDQVELRSGPGISITTDQDEAVVLSAAVGFEQVDLEVTTSDGAWTTLRAVGVPYSTVGGNWHIRVAIYGRTWAPESDITLQISGLRFKNVDGYNQPLAVYLRSNTVPGLAFTTPGSNQIRVVATNESGKTNFNISGDLELEEKPAFVD